MQSTVIFDPASRAALGRLVTQTSLRAFAEVLSRRVAKQRPFSCLITGNAELRRLNRKFRHENYVTDVLSFPSEAAGPAIEVSMGEMAISADRALKQAREHGHSLADELHILMLHGVLHLMGYDHETDLGEMAATESRWRQRLRLPQGLIERAQK